MEIYIILSLLLYAGLKNNSINGIKKSTFENPYEGKRTTFLNTQFKSGVYLIKKKDSGKIVYVGHSKNNLYRTLYRHFQKWTHSQKVITYSDPNQYTVRVILTTPTQAARLEAYLIQKYNPVDNEHKMVKYENTNTGKSEYEKMKEAAPF